MFRIAMLKRRRTLFIAAMLAIGVVTYDALTSGSIGSSKQVEKPTTYSASTTEMEVELITLKPGWFEPSTITRPKDPFVLFIDDRSGKETVSLILQRVKGDLLRTVDLNRKSADWHGVIDLAPGDYVLVDPSNPELLCQITILP